MFNLIARLSLTKNAQKNLNFVVLVFNLYTVVLIFVILAISKASLYKIIVK